MPNQNPEVTNYNSLFDECFQAPYALPRMTKAEVEAERVGFYIHDEGLENHIRELEASDYRAAQKASVKQKEHFQVLLENFDMLNFMHRSATINDGCVHPENEQEDKYLSDYHKKYEDDHKFRAAEDLFIDIAKHSSINYEPRYYDLRTRSSIPQSVLCYNKNKTQYSLSEVKNAAELRKQKNDRAAKFEKETVKLLLENYELLDKVHALPTKDGSLYFRTEAEKDTLSRYHALCDNGTFTAADSIFTRALNARNKTFDSGVYDYTFKRVMSHREINERNKFVNAHNKQARGIGM